MEVSGNNMSKFFFSGSVTTKIDDKNRFVLPQAMRYGLVEEGKLEFVIALGMGGSLAIYRKSDIEKIVEKFREKQHLAKYQRFFTLFFSTLHHTTCDKLGRLVIPSILKKAAKIDGEIVVCGVLGKIEIWQKDKYEADLMKFMEEDADDIVEEAFGLLAEEPKLEKKSELADLSPSEKKEYDAV